MNRKEIKELQNFYGSHLRQVILPFWLPKTDRRYGGFFTCYDPQGTRLLSEDKYVWSQGRCTWMYARLAEDVSAGLDEGLRQQCRQRAVMGADFPLNYCLLSDGGCAFLLSADHTPREPWPGSGYAASTFADCFVVMGLAAAAETLRKENYLTEAVRIYRRAANLLKAGMFRTAPTVLPKGWRAHAPFMIMIHTGEELRRSLVSFSRWRDAEWTDTVIGEAMDELCGHFIRPSGVVQECLGPEYELLESVYGRHINPGHTNESMWFLIRSALRMGRQSVVGQAANAIRHTSKLAWDPVYGGLFYYLDRDGGQPHGAAPAAEKALTESVLRDCGCKLWWVHTETLYANLLCYFLTRDEEFLENFARCHAYTFSTFPNPDPEVGEWIQLRCRDGSPNLAAVGGRLPVKDPYHITRNLLLLCELLEAEAVKYV